MKKACSILLILMLLLTGCAGETDPVPSGDGATADVDGNGTVDYEDAVYLLLHVMFGEAFYPIEN